MPLRPLYDILEAAFGPLLPAGENRWYGTCPGASCHTTSNGRRDFVIFLDEAGDPHETCFHASCAAARDAAMKNVYQQLAALKRGANQPAAGAAPAPQEARRPAVLQPSKPFFDAAAAARAAAKCPLTATPAWLRAISPVPIPASPLSWPRLFLDTLYRPGENILIFNKFRSQGQWCYTVGQNLRPLAAWPGQKIPVEKGMKPVMHLGCWFLAAPVTGKWERNPNNNNQPTRRSACNVTRYPYAVLESDTIAPAQWLAILATRPEPIAAIYSSGGKSIHALIALPPDTRTPEQFNALKKNILQRLVPLGADPAALTPVRLSRLPGVIRGEKNSMQELYYLNPVAKPNAPLAARNLLRPL